MKERAAIAVIVFTLAISWMAAMFYFIFMLLFTSHAYPHMAKPTQMAQLGWEYDYVCCSGEDCREISEAEITEGPDGYTVPSGEVIRYGSTKIKQSKDGMFHWCFVKPNSVFPAGFTRCLYVPPRGF